MHAIQYNYGFLYADKVTEDVEFQLEENLDLIKTRYASFVASLCEKVERQVAPKQLCLFLRNLSAFSIRSRQRSLLPPKVIAELNEAETIYAIFKILDEKCASFINYGIFQKILKKYCPYAKHKDFKCEDLKYAQYFHQYIEKNNVSEFIRINPKLKEYCTEESSKLIIKLNLKHTEKFSKVMDTKYCIAAMYKIQPSLLRIVDIREGCVEVTLLIPTHIAKILFHPDANITAQQEIGLKNMSVMRLQCNRYTLNFASENDYLPVPATISLTVSVIITIMHY